MALTPITAPPAVRELPAKAAHAISDQAVALTDNWSQLFILTVSDLQGLWDVANTGLPATSNPIAPIAEQAVINAATYAGQIVTGQGGKIPGEIVTHLNGVRSAVNASVGQLVTTIAEIGQLVVVQLAATWQYIRTHNPVQALFEAPASLLYIPVAMGTALTADALLTRNAIAKAIDPPLPKWLSWLSPFASTTARAAAPVSASSASSTALPEAKRPMSRPKAAGTTGMPAAGTSVTGASTAGKSKIAAAVNNSSTGSPKKNSPGTHGSAESTSHKHTG